MCSVCSNPADAVCKACKGTPDGVGGSTAVYYCSDTCQKIDWDTHKPACKASRDRQAVHRMGHIAQRLFITFRRNTWKWPIERLEIGRGPILWADIGRLYVGEIWKIVDGEHPQNMKKYFLPFPKETFPDVQQQEAVLSQGGCRFAMFLVGNLLKDMLKDTNAQVREVCTRVKDTRMMLVRYQQSNVPVFTSAWHDVFRITLSNKQSYALDLTAAQYGWHGSATMPWPTFEQERLDTIGEVRKMGETAKTLRADIEAGDRARKQHQDVLEGMKEGFDHYLREWQRQNISFKALLRCSEAEFKSKQDLLLDFMDKRIFKLGAEVDKRIEDMKILAELNKRFGAMNSSV
ncbi:MAG: hypothetical protein Q9166_006525 [cf. Caloplaca sp. 2 TL-2023]